ncbi:DNA cytosine methyltransferase [Aeromicrobium fastidiosum]|uniref:DNA (cytosine-5-)-methyltransferase n=1 Tax=Aeromicrobium fastidiosum TaxID=52699 RepID=A0A641AT04_9ACTN|nr:DNA (cytosine-5-)-methyltransferase [Aeromicrobium fastidiosum]KAA1380191.1 DNA (cytosine-5-)-methyltransferase [Aeromicrobium fastidiosum]MBP2389735.1 DNA (cytosine-5)-methyltransferase 1 [Aeromicrobium fastidiosum]
MPLVAQEPPRLSTIRSTSAAPRVAEFFAGIGLARLGLEQAGAEVVWANDLDPNKTLLYTSRFGGDHYVERDIATITGADVPDIDLAWSSFPCTDLSLAGNRRGLAGSSSATFWEFTRILEEMGDRRPAVVALENVTGFATSHGGDDMASAVAELNRLGYSVDVVTLDARRFVPQSRPRLFLVGALDAPDDVHDPGSELRPDWLQTVFGDPALTTHRAALPAPPAPLTSGLGEVVERSSTLWWDADRTRSFLDSLSPLQTERVELLRRGRTVSYRTAYRRTRKGVAIWEVRPDDIAGCLRTARGGSSKQAVVRAGRGQVQVRWMTGREYARLMGAGDYDLSAARTSQALFGFGDAVCVPAVGWLSEHYLLPLVRGAMRAQSPALELVHG